MSTDTTSIDVDAALRNVAQTTEEIRALQRAIKEKGIERRRVIIDLRKEAVTYRSIASSMGTTEQNVYKILRSANENAA
jgi:DNA-directed RNA polymerase specialized sigma24 family protein